MVGTQTYYQRYATSGFDPNDLALTLALSIPVSYYLSLKSGNPARWLCRLQIVAVSAIILLTGSRGGMLTMLVGLSIVFTTWNLLPQAARLSHRSIAFLLALAVAIGVWLIPVSTWKRLGTLGTEVRQGTLNDRTVLWSGGWQAFRDVPLQGVGAGAYAEGLTPVLGRPRDFTPVAHNSFLSVLVETGLVGFLLFLTMFGTLMMAVRRMASLERRLWLTCLATWSLGVFALTWEHRKPTWLFFALLATHAGTLESSRVGRRKNAADRLPRPSWPVAEVA